jgi:hypothetical protein
MEDNTVDTTLETTEVDTTTETDTVESQVETKPQSKQELLRELSKEYGVNLFEAEGIAKFKEFQESQKTEQDKLQEQITALNDEKAQWQSKQLEYESKLEASKLGIPQDKIEDALKLAGGDVKELANVIKKYPIFQSKDGISIGIQDNNSFNQPTGNTEVEQYMASNPKIYKK